MVLQENESLLIMKSPFENKSCYLETEQEVDSHVLEVSVKYPVNFAGSRTSGKNVN